MAIRAELAIVIWLLSTFGVTFIAAYMGAYLKKKGENLATHEDIHRLVDQVSAVTTATEAIRSQVSDEAWNRQKRWDMKREVLFSAAKAVAEVDDALISMGSVFAQPIADDNLVVVEARTKSGRRWLDACTKFDEARLLVAIVCNEDTKSAFDSFAEITSRTSQIVTKHEWEALDGSRKEVAVSLFGLQAAVRKELEIEKLSKPRSPG